jgi:hypothetical protein
MKAGTESKTKLRIAIVLGIIAIVVVGRTLIPLGTSNGTSSSQPAPVAVSTAGRTAETVESLDPRLRLDLLASAEEVKYEGKGKNIFRAASVVEIPSVKVPPLHPGGGSYVAPNVYIPPPPPPINLKFFGITNAKGEAPKAFLSQGDNVWIAREGDVVNLHYKIVRISPNVVEVEDLLNNNRQNIPLTQG